MKALKMFVLTRREQHLIAFVIVAFMLGLLTKNYREGHPRVASVAAKPEAALSSPARPPKASHGGSPAPAAEDAEPADNE
jgi:hypothetical protein